MPTEIVAALTRAGLPIPPRHRILKTGYTAREHKAIESYRTATRRAEQRQNEGTDQ